LYQASHFSISIRHEFGVIPGTFLDTIREEVRIATQPPLSGESNLPGVSGSYLADEQ
jgi:hypothetical protein